MKVYTMKDGTEWLRVSKDLECPICNHNDWCLISPDQTIAVCQRVKEGGYKTTTMGTFHKLTGKKVDLGKLKRVEVQEIAHPTILHRVYSLVISVLGLSQEHMRHLMVERGLTEKQIKLRGYASSQNPNMNNQVKSCDIIDGKPVVKTIWEDLFEKNGLSKDAWLGVPGFFWHPTQNCPVFDTVEGILIPSRNSWGQIIRMQIRVDESNIKHFSKVNDNFKNKFRVVITKVNDSYHYVVRSLSDMEVVAEGDKTDKYVEFENGFSFTIKQTPKYLAVSSSGKNKGTASSAEAHYAFPDRVLAKAKFDKDGKSKVYLLGKVNNVIVTEGLLKADIISSLIPKSQLKSLGSVVVISMPGVSSWEKVAKRIVADKFETAYIAFDQDFEINLAVFEALSSTVAFLTFGRGISTHVMVWENGKGLDDFLLSDQSKIEEIQYQSYYQPK